MITCQQKPFFRSCNESVFEMYYLIERSRVYLIQHLWIINILKENKNSLITMILELFCKNLKILWYNSLKKTTIWSILITTLKRIFWNKIRKKRSLLILKKSVITNRKWSKKRDHTILIALSKLKKLLI